MNLRDWKNIHKHHRAVQTILSVFLSDVQKEYYLEENYGSTYWFRIARRFLSEAIFTPSFNALDAKYNDDFSLMNIDKSKRF